MASTIEGNPQKRQKTSKLIGTHNGTFHCDEALAVFLLRQTPTYREADLIRTRDSSKLAECDIVVDVGGEYVEERSRFDHHQRGFTEVFGHGFETKLSSAGLIYKYFGREIISRRFQFAEDDPKVETLWLKLYKEFIEAIDGVDNGVSQYPLDITPKYRNRTDLSSQVAWLNPAWNESVDSTGVDERFLVASSLTGTTFLGRLDYYANAWLPARDIVRDGLDSRSTIDPSRKIVLFIQFAPWKEHLHELEAEANVQEDEKPLYVLYPDEFASAWRIQAVSVTPDSFESRKALPEAWRGLRDEALSEATGVPGCIFIHASGFIGGNKTREGALALARLALTL